MRQSLWILPGFVIWQLSGLLGAYVGGRNDIQWWIGTSLDRILAQVAPLALLTPALLAGRWMAADPQLTRRPSYRNLKTKQVKSK